MGNDNIVSGDGNINFPHLLNNEVAWLINKIYVFFVCLVTIISLLYIIQLKTGPYVMFLPYKCHDVMLLTADF